jgi:PAS domain S-box-containing protein
MESSIINPRRILLIDDDEDEYILTREMLANARDERYLLDWRANFEDGLDAIRCNQFDAILIDFYLGQDNGIELIMQARKSGCTVPIILITGAGDQEVDREAMIAGATDYLDRSEVTPALLERAIRYTIRNHRAALESQALVEAERAKLNMMGEKVPVGIFMTDAQGQFTLINPVGKELFPPGTFDPGSGGAAFDFQICHSDGTVYQMADSPIARSLQGETILNEEMLIRYKDGTDIYLLDNTLPIYQDGLITGTVSAVRDVTEMVKAQRALKESQEREQARASELEAIMNTVPVAVWIARDPEGQRIDGNEYGYEILRMKPGENLSASAPENAPNHFKVIQDGRELTSQEMGVQLAARGGVIDNFECATVFEDGEVIHLLGNVRPVIRDGKPVGAVSAFINITERKEIERALQMSEERFRSAVRAMKGIVWDYDFESSQVFRSEGLESLTGFTTAELPTSEEAWLARIDPEDNQAGQMSMKVLLSQYETSYSREYRFHHKAGHWVWVQEQGNIICDENGNPVRVVGTTIDIDARKQAELALRESEERFRRVLDNTSTVMFTMDRDLRYTWIYNPGPLFSEQEILGKREDELLDAEAAEILMAPKREVLATGKPVQRELTYKVKGQTVAYHVSFEPIFANTGEVTGISAVAMEITDLAKMRQQQIDDQARIEIQQRIIEQREQERLQIARDLHDGPLQVFTGILIYLQDLVDRTKSDPELSKIVQDLKQDIQTGIGELRHYATELRPPTLASFGFEKAIWAHLQEFKRRHPDIQVQFEAKQVGDILSEAPRMALYRIYQELMNNIIKHARATEIDIQFEKTLEVAELIVRDNGVGFSVPSDWLELARHKHLGLVGLQERVEAVGGRVEIRSKPGKGTTVRVVIPLPEGD